jgi:4-hydroxy-3-polyprenylbenzoate decarboxylase
MEKPKEKHSKSDKIIIGITGASGAIYGIRALEVLRGIRSIETHLIISSAGKQTIELETDWSVSDVETLAEFAYDQSDIAAAIASGSYKVKGMLIAPCSIKTLSAIANSFDSTLIARTADVQLKERRSLVMLIRETPLHRGHLRLMDLAAKNGAVIMPASPSFYGMPKTIEELVDSVIGRALALLDVETSIYPRWKGA